MAFKLSNEKAIDVLIWWIEGSDGSIDFHEEKAVKKILNDMDYSLKTYHEETLMHIGGLSTEHLNDLVDNAIRYGSDHLSAHRKEQTIALLYAIAESNGKITDGQQEKIDKIKKAFRVNDPQVWQEE